MNILLADIGGTNTRLALADASGLRNDTFARHPNANWNHFDEILESYLREHSAPRIEACWIAVAGDVNDRTATTSIGTRRNGRWTLDAASIERASGARRVEFIHDMRALGHSLPDVDRIPICGALGSHRNGQILVVNLGTGFNICLIRVEGGRAIVYDTQGGDSHLPSSVRDLLCAEIAAADFSTNGTCRVFDGGRAAVFARAITGKDLNHDEVTQSFCGGQAGRVYASALGTLAQSLVCTYMPGHGIVFAGGMARSVLGSAAASAFIEKFWQDSGGMVGPHNFPVSLIKDDAASLRGCLRYARGLAHTQANHFINDKHGWSRK